MNNQPQGLTKKPRAFAASSIIACLFTIIITVLALYNASSVQSDYPPDETFALALLALSDIVEVILVCLIGCIIGLSLAALGWKRKEEQILVTIGFVSNFILMLVPLSALIGI